MLFTGLECIVNFWLFHNGFSIGIGDTIADKETMSFVDKKISEKENVLIQQAQKDELKPSLEFDLHKAPDDSGRHAQTHLKDNNVRQMMVAGSNGSFINISQVSVSVGQQSVEGRRISFGFKHRTLPHFTKDYFSPEARDFVENSYLRGLTPQEFFFHAMAR